MPGQRNSRCSYKRSPATPTPKVYAERSTCVVRTLAKRGGRASAAPEPAISCRKTSTATETCRCSRRLAQERSGTRRLEGSPELLLGRARQTVRERELDVRVLRYIQYTGNTAATANRTTEERRARVRKTRARQYVWIRINKKQAKHTSHESSHAEGNAIVQHVHLSCSPVSTKRRAV